MRRYYLREREVGEPIIDNKRENDYGYGEEQVYYYKEYPIFHNRNQLKDYYILMKKTSLTYDRAGPPLTRTRPQDTPSPPVQSARARSAA